MLKHHFSSMLKYDPDHFGHSPNKPPHPNVTKKWAAVRDLDDLYTQYGRRDGERMVIDLAGAGYEKLLGGGTITSAYTVVISASTKSAAQKVADAGGEVLTKYG